MPLRIRNLSVYFETVDGSLAAVEGLNLDVADGEVAGIVGESGSGKSVAMMALMGLLPRNAWCTADCLEVDGRSLINAVHTRKRRGVGKDLAMIFQEPTTSLNPVFTVGYQIKEALRINGNYTNQDLRNRAIDLLMRVGIPEPESRLRAYPHQLSGGMAQRIMIAIALACKPRFLIADEPTTALDVTIQRQIIDLLLEIQSEEDMGLILISHNMGVISETAHSVTVMYCGRVCETREASAFFSEPAHHYSQGLLRAMPQNVKRDEPLAAIRGVVPQLRDRFDGCLFAPRCDSSTHECWAGQPKMRSVSGGCVACIDPLTTNNVPLDKQ